MQACSAEHGGARHTWGAVGTGKRRKAPSPWFQPRSKDLYDQVETRNMAQGMHAHVAHSYCLQ